MDQADDQRHSHSHNDPDHEGSDQESDQVNAGSLDEVQWIFKVSGLDCADEVATLKREIGPLVGGEAGLAFDLLNGRMIVMKDATSVSASEIRKAVARTGMLAEEWQPSLKNTDGDKHRQQQAWLTALSGLSVAVGVGLHIWLAGGLAAGLKLFSGHGGNAMPLAEVVAYGLAIVFGIRFVVPKAWFSARRLRPDMNLLMVIAICGAIGIGEMFEAATVAFLFALSLALENWSVGRARRAVSALLDLAPAMVRVTRLGTEQMVPAADVAMSTRFVVAPGERIPLDGVVDRGRSNVNQAPITGESIPVNKHAGDEVFAGTINGDGVLEVVSSKLAEDTTLARIIRMVEAAHSRRANVEQWVEKFAAVYTPAIIVLAIAVAATPPLLAGADWAEWFYRALVLLVIACPCALVISTPVSIVAALASSARQGVLIKGGSFIEQPARLRAIAFDKTGTLTLGEPRVVKVIPLNGHSAAELLERSAALEARSTHPLARAVVRYAQEQEIRPAPADDVQVLGGLGVTGIFAGEPFWLGSHRYLVERGQGSPYIAAQADALERDGTTVVAVGNSKHVCGLLAIADTVRPGAKHAIASLRAIGIEHLVMLTGDNTATAEAIAAATGIDEVHAELLPADKVDVIEMLADKYQFVAMVGDGVNDAPAMARANLGIAMGAAGSDAAIETADIALMTDDLNRLPWLVGHSRRTLAIIRQNIIFALGVKTVFVVLTFAGFATLWGAIAADVGASLLVVANALRLLQPHDLAYLKRKETTLEDHSEG